MRRLGKRVGELKCEWCQVNVFGLVFLVWLRVFLNTHGLVCRGIKKGLDIGVVDSLEVW